MPTPGDYHEGSEAQILVGTTSPASTKLGGVKSATYTTTRQTTVDDLYNQEPSQTNRGKANRRWTVQGIASTGDVGLLLVKASIDTDAGTTLFMAGSLEGTNGEDVQGDASSLEIGFPDANRRSTYSFQFDANADPTDFTAGGILEAVA